MREDFKPGAYVSPSCDAVDPITHTQYLTKDKPYLVTHVPTEKCFYIVDDSGGPLMGLWEGCRHLEGGTWRVVELDKELNDAEAAQSPV